MSIKSKVKGFLKKLLEKIKIGKPSVLKDGDDGTVNPDPKPPKP